MPDFVMSPSLRILTIAGAALVVIAAGPPPSLSVPLLGNVVLGGSEAQRGLPQLTASVSPPFTSAPVPNTEAGIPFVRDPRDKQPRIAPSVFSSAPTAYHGDGYVPGSSVDTEQQRRTKPATGINLKVPLN